MKLVNKNNEKKYTDFLKKHNRCNFLQSIEWGKVKKYWKNEIIIIEDDDENIIGSISVLIRKIPLFGNLIYAPRGPVCNINDKNVLNELANGLKCLAKQYNAFVIRIEPDIKSDELLFKENIKSLKYKIKDSAKKFSQEIQPRYVFKLDIKNKTEEEVFNSFSSKTRYNIRLAVKKGVIVKEGKKEDLKKFHDIMIITGERDKFVTRPLDYFEHMYDTFGKKHIKLWMAYYKGQAIAGILNISYGDKVCYLYGASSNENRNVMPNYLLQWNAIKNAIEQKEDVYDFRGVCGVIDKNDPQYGLYRFKKGFNAEFTEYIGEIYNPVKPIKYFLYTITERLIRRLPIRTSYAKAKAFLHVMFKDSKLFCKRDTAQNE